MTGASPAHHAVVERSRRRDSWGGRAVVAALLGAYGYNVVDRLVDGAHVVLDQEGRRVLVGHGNVAALFGVGLFAVAVSCACVAMTTRSGRRSIPVPAVVALQGLVVWWALLSVLVPRAELGLPDYVILGAVPLVFGVAADPPTLRTCRSINTLRDLLAVGQVAYALLDPMSGQIRCRPDKCGIFGSLAVGFFFQENSGPAALVAVLPLAAASRSRGRAALSVTLVFVAVLASGSRTGLFAALLATAVVVALRWAWSRHRQGPVAVPRVVRMLPLLGTIGSLVVFLTSDAESLTGRGALYAAIRDALTGPPLLYGIPWNTVAVASNGFLTGDHGQAPHVLAKAGVVGLVLWAVAMAAIAWRSRRGPTGLLALGVLVGLVPEMLTESAVELSARSIGFVTLLLVVGLLAADAQAEATPTSASVGGERRLIVAGAGLAALGVVAAVGLVALGPPRHLAAQTIGVTTRPVPDVGELDEVALPSWTAARSAAVLGGSPSDDDAVTDRRVTNAPHTTAVEITTTATDPESARAETDELRRRIEAMLGPSSVRSPAPVARQLGPIVVEPVSGLRSYGLQAGGLALAGATLGLLVALPSSRPRPTSRPRGALSAR